MSGAIGRNIVEGERELINVMEMSKRSMSKAVLREHRLIFEDSLFLFAKYVVGLRDMLPTLQYPEHTLHYDLCEFIQDPTEKKKEVLIPRGCFKSSIGSIAYPLWRLVKDPNTRILMAASRSELSEKFVKAIETVITGSSMFRLFWPEYVVSEEYRRNNVWSAGAFKFPGRTKMMKENSVEACGVSASRAGIHVDLVICDDLVCEAAMKSQVVMDDAIDWLRLHDALFDSPDTGETLVIGTRWTHRDIYWYLEEQDKRYKKFMRDCYDENGDPINPAKHTKKGLEKLRSSMTSYLFSCQYRNNPCDPDRMDFRESWFDYYHFEEKEDGQQFIVTHDNRHIDPASLDILMAVDPADSSNKDDCDNAIIVAGRHWSGDIFVLEAVAERGAPSEIIEKIFELHRRWKPRMVLVEAIAYQKTLITWVQEKQDKTGYQFYIRTVHPGHTDKRSRILVLEPYARNKFVNIRRDHNKLLDQFINFPLGKYVDLIDAFSYLPNAFIPLQNMEGYIDNEEYDEFELVPLHDGRSEVTGY